MILLHLAFKIHPRISAMKLVSAVSCFSSIPASYKSNLSCNYIQASTKSVVPGLLIPTRTFWETFPDTRRYTLFEKDGIDRDRYELIYRSKMFGYVFYTQLGSEIVMAVQAVFGLNFVVRSLMGYKVAFFENAAVPVVFDAIGLVIFSYFTLQTSFLVVLAQRTVLRIYYSEEDKEYIVIFLKMNPFVTQQFRCKPGDLMHYSWSFFATLFGNFRLKEKRVIMNLNYFKNTFHYNHLLGSVQG